MRPPGVHRTTIDLDLAAYERARAVLGTRGYRDTVNRALSEVGRLKALRQAAELVREGRVNMVTPDDLETLRTPRV